jgi:hypothetical protein
MFSQIIQTGLLIRNAVNSRRIQRHDYFTTLYKHDVERGMVE